jgi:hypothetical protein
MKLSLISVFVGLSMAVPGAVLAQESVSCEPQTIAQWLGLEAIPGCEAEAIAPGTEVPDTGERTGLQTAHEASEGRSTQALEHANTMSGGAVLAALRDDDSDPEDDEDTDRGGGRPADAGRGRP